MPVSFPQRHKKSGCFFPFMMLKYLSFKPPPNPSWHSSPLTSVQDFSLKKYLLNLIFSWYLTCSKSHHSFPIISLKNIQINWFCFSCHTCQFLSDKIPAWICSSCPGHMVPNSSANSHWLLLFKLCFTALYPSFILSWPGFPNTLTFSGRNFYSSFISSVKKYQQGCRTSQLNC